MSNIATILIDFDYTLFDTNKFVKSLQSSPETINFKEYLYPDALEFISYASKFGDLVLFSEGDMDFQKAKIKGTGIGKLFAGGVKIFPSYSKMQGLLGIADAKNTVLIDDKPEIVDEAVPQKYKVIRVMRGKYSRKSSKFKPDFEVDSLTEIIDQDLLRII